MSSGTRYMDAPSRAILSQFECPFLVPSTEAGGPNRGCPFRAPCPFGGQHDYGRRRSNPQNPTKLPKKIPSYICGAHFVGQCANIARCTVLPRCEVGFHLTSPKELLQMDQFHEKLANLVLRGNPQKNPEQNPQEIVEEQQEKEEGEPEPAKQSKSGNDVDNYDADIEVISSDDDDIISRNAESSRIRSHKSRKRQLSYPVDIGDSVFKKPTVDYSNIKCLSVNKERRDKLAKLLQNNSSDIKILDFVFVKNPTKSENILPVPEEKPGSKPTCSKNVEPIAMNPSTVVPITIEPISVEPTTVKPITPEPVSVEPISVGPNSIEPISVEPIAAEPITTKPSENPTTTTPNSNPSESDDDVQILEYPDDNSLPISLINQQNPKPTVPTTTSENPITTVEQKPTNDANPVDIGDSISKKPTTITVPRTFFCLASKETRERRAKLRQNVPSSSDIEILDAVVEDPTESENILLVPEKEPGSEPTCSKNVKPMTVNPSTVEPTTVKPITPEPVSVEPISVRPNSVEPISVEPITTEPYPSENPTTTHPNSNPSESDDDVQILEYPDDNSLPIWPNDQHNPEPTVPTTTSENPTVEQKPTTAPNPENFQPSTSEDTAAPTPPNPNPLELDDDVQFLETEYSDGDSDSGPEDHQNPEDSVLTVPVVQAACVSSSGEATTSENVKTKQPMEPTTINPKNLKPSVDTTTLPKESKLPTPSHQFDSDSDDDVQFIE